MRNYSPPFSVLVVRKELMTINAQWWAERSAGVNNLPYHIQVPFVCIFSIGIELIEVFSHSSASVLLLIFLFRFNWLTSRLRRSLSFQYSSSRPIYLCSSSCCSGFLPGIFKHDQLVSLLSFIIKSLVNQLAVLQISVWETDQVTIPVRILMVFILF